MVIILLLFVRLYSNYSLTAFALRYFLLSGYAVIFMHREKSLFPFLRHFQHQNILEWFTVNSDQASVQRTCWSSVADPLIFKGSDYMYVCVHVHLSV